jgi:hypothetical protein
MSVVLPTVPALQVDAGALPPSVLSRWTNCVLLSVPVPPASTAPTSSHGIEPEPPSQ